MLSNLEFNSLVLGRLILNSNLKGRWVVDVNILGGNYCLFSVQHYLYQCTRKITCLTTFFFKRIIKIFCVECYAHKVECEMTSRSLRVAPTCLSRVPRRKGG